MGQIDLSKFVLIKRSISTLKLTKKIRVYEVQISGTGVRVNHTFTLEGGSRIRY